MVGIDASDDLFDDGERIPECELDLSIDPDLERDISEDGGTFLETNPDELYMNLMRSTWRRYIDGVKRAKLKNILSVWVAAQSDHGSSYQHHLESRSNVKVDALYEKGFPVYF